MTEKAIPAPTSLIEAVIYFADKDRSFQFVRDLRWPDGCVRCPRCDVAEPMWLATRRVWKCRACRRQFSIKVGTIFENSPLGFEKWIPAVWLIANSKNSISSHELGRALHVTQRTAWFMLHRIREAMATGSFAKMTGTVEVDETYIGGLAKNMHKDARARRIHGTGGTDKVAVQGARQRGGEVRAEVIHGTDAAALQANIYKWVEVGSAVYTDQATGYRGLDRGYAHKTVNHSIEYVSGDVHINGCENFWSLLKRSIKGTQVHVSRAHMHRYVNERTFAYNLCEDSDLTRLRSAMAGTNGKRLTYAALTDHD